MSSPFVALRTRMSLSITFRALCKVADILSDLTKFKCSQLIFTKSTIKLQVNPFSGWRPDTYGRPVGSVSLTGASRNYANSPTTAVRNCVKHMTISWREQFRTALLGSWQNCEVTISFVMSVCLSVCSSAWNNSAPTGRIFVEFVLFFTNLSRGSKFH